MKNERLSIQSARLFTEILRRIVIQWSLQGIRIPFPGLFERVQMSITSSRWMILSQFEAQNKHFIKEMACRASHIFENS